METSELQEFLIAEYSKVCHKEVNPEEDLISLGYLDSIGLVNLIVAIEAKLSIKIPAEEIRDTNFGSINKAIAFLQHKANG